MNMTPHTLMATIARIWAAAESNLDSAGLVSFASAGTSGVRPARRMKPSATNATAAGTTSFQNSPSFQPYRMTAHVMAVTAATPNVAEAPKNHSRP